MYADKITDSMQQTIDETERRRAKQQQYNELHGITPTPIVKKSSARDLIELYGESKETKETNTPTAKRAAARKAPAQTAAPRPYIEEEHTVAMAADPVIEYMSDAELRPRIDKVSADMLAASRRTDFIEAAQLRDELLSLQELLKERETVALP